MKRRDFLRATLVTAGSIVAPAACTEEEDPALGACTLQDGAAFFPQSVASGDPRPTSVVIWTRLDDPAVPGDLEISVKMALDEGFTQLVAWDELGSTLLLVAAPEAYDRCVKLKVTNLTPGTTYYYQFFYASGGGCYTSRVGRTKTAPEADADVAVKFAYVSCQDYIGRFYNTHLALAQQDLDFFVHLGDYIYETTGDSTFQSDTGRTIAFVDVEGAIEFQPADPEALPYYAARSLSNYRQLHQTYRSDAALQAVHEKFPMIAIWDDHEFSDDSHGATATYFDGRIDETDVERRKNANQAWFEYMPVDYNPGPDPDEFAYDAAADYPQDITIYRDFVYGAHVHLVMTDLRSYRADHLIPEDAFPGAVVATQADLVAELGMVPAIATPYMDIETFKNGYYKTELSKADNATALGYDPAKVTGLISANFVNGVIADLNAGGQTLVPITDAEILTMELGFSYLDVGKVGFYSQVGSRYFVVKEVFDVIAKRAYAMTGKASEDVHGGEQELWFLDTIQNSSSTWKIWGNEYCLIPLVVDLTAFELPEQFKRKFYMNVDAWDGFRNKRSELIGQLAGVGNVVAITGDIHAFYAGTPMTNDDPAAKIVELVGGAVASAPFKELLKSQVAADPVLSQVPMADALADAIDALLQSTSTMANPHLGYANSSDHGFCVVEADGAELVVTMHQIPAEHVATDFTGLEQDLMALIETKRFKAVAGENELYRDADGIWERWDPTTMAWMAV